MTNGRRIRHEDSWNPVSVVREGSALPCFSHWWRSSPRRGAHRRSRLPSSGSRRRRPRSASRCRSPSLARATTRRARSAGDGSRPAAVTWAPPWGRARTSPTPSRAPARTASSRRSPTQARRTVCDRDPQPDRPGHLPGLRPSGAVQRVERCGRQERKHRRLPNGIRDHRTGLLRVHGHRGHLRRPDRAQQGHRLGLDRRIADQAVDLYSPRVGTISLPVTGLTDAAHRILVRPTGTKNPASTGTFVNVEEFAVGATRVDDRASVITYSSWLGLAEHQRKWWLRAAQLDPGRQHGVHVHRDVRDVAEHAGPEPGSRRRVHRRPARGDGRRICRQDHLAGRAHLRRARPTPGTSSAWWCGALTTRTAWVTWSPATLSS